LFVQAFIFIADAKILVASKSIITYPRTGIKSFAINYVGWLTPN
jgi:hypothetical protein